MKLYLAEELYLLALDDQKGKISNSVSQTLPFGLAGAMLADLTLQKKVGLDENNKLSLLDAMPGDDPALNAVVEIIAASKRPRKLKFWIKVLSDKKFWKPIPASLVAKGILTKEDRRFLWVIPYVAYPQQDASAKYSIKAQLRALALANAETEPQRVALLSLVHACQMTNLVFTKDERKQASRRIKDLVRDEVIGESVTQTIQEIEAMTTAAVIAATSG